jgi:hypothetical protein
VGLRHRAEVVATAYADKLSIRSLAEISAITVDQNVRIAAITIEVASSGVIHQRLLDRGYVATSGNSYTRPVPDLAVAGAPVPELAVDLLVPSLDGRFRSQEYGGRAFDSAPGLAPALAADPIMIETGARLLDGTYVEFTVPVPTVEPALVIKALSCVTVRSGLLRVPAQIGERRTR